MTGVYEIRPAQWWDWPFHGVIAEQASIPAVTTLPASDDQQAVTVRFSYPRPVVSGFAGDGSNSGENPDTASGFVTGSCPDIPVLPMAQKQLDELDQRWLAVLSRNNVKEHP
jgi:hypothetical protein